MTDQKNVLVIVCDQLRADFLGTYGCPCFWAVWVGSGWGGERRFRAKSSTCIIELHGQHLICPFSRSSHFGMRVTNHLV